MRFIHSANLCTYVLETATAEILNNKKNQQQKQEQKTSESQTAVCKKKTKLKHLF
jgi:hypothetical protein